MSGGWSCDVSGPPMPGAENCVNMVDDDGDKRVDCLDPKCFEHSACSGFVERCDNGTDDNADGKVDCVDLLCAGQGCGPACTCIGGQKVFDHSTEDGGHSTDGGAGTDAGLPDAGDCDAGSWGVVRAGMSVTAYVQPFAAAGQRCSDVAETRVCTQGMLSGAASFSACHNYACSWADAGFQYEAWYSEGDGDTFPHHRCQSDGGWSMPLAPPQPDAGDVYCAWNGTFVSGATCASYGGATFSCTGSGWMTDTSCPPEP